MDVDVKKQKRREYQDKVKQRCAEDPEYNEKQRELDRERKRKYRMKESTKTKELEYQRARRADETFRVEEQRRAQEKRYTFEGRVKNILARAKKFNLVVGIDGTGMIAMMEQPCFYCNTDGAGDIGQFDTFKGYTFDNCVPSCGRCNLMKGSLDPISFVQRSRHRAGVSLHPEVFEGTRLDPKYSVYKSNAAYQGVKFELSKEEFYEISEKECAYCKRPPPNKRHGIARIDKSAGYIVDNCVACCWGCRHAKSTMTDEEFKERDALLAMNYDRVMKELQKYPQISRCTIIRKSA